MQAVLVLVMGHINGRDRRHVPGNVFGHELLNLDFSSRWASYALVFITGLPTDSCVFYAWTVYLRLPFRA